MKKKCVFALAKFALSGEWLVMPLIIIGFKRFPDFFTQILHYRKNDKSIKNIT